MPSLCEPTLQISRMANSTILKEHWGADREKALLRRGEQLKVPVFKSLRLWLSVSAQPFLTTDCTNKGDLEEIIDEIQCLKC